MKVFISADVEGIASTVLWDECRPEKPGYAAAYYHVPTVYLSGDKQLCETYASLHPKLVTTAVKEGDAFAAVCMSPTQAIATIEKDVTGALEQDLSNACITLPDTFEVEIRYKEHYNSFKPSYYPGMKRLDDNTLLFKAKDYMDVLTMMKFCL